MHKANVESLEKHRIRAEILHKKWDECSIEEKIEKLRSELKEVSYLNQRFYELERRVIDLCSHQHVNNEVVVPIEKRTQSNSAMGSSRMDYLA